ncbi:MAG: hypothetical protein J5I98_16840 [Phaeodactylibacter sp.]|nr:hypothetical protein [Phaeodactylibacter sp.]
MSIEEACKILGCQPGDPLDEVELNYKSRRAGLDALDDNEFTRKQQKIRELELAWETLEEHRSFRPGEDTKSNEGHEKPVETVRTTDSEKSKIEPRDSQKPDRRATKVRKLLLGSFSVVVLIALLIVVFKIFGLKMKPDTTGAVEGLDSPAIDTALVSLKEEPIHNFLLNDRLQEKLLQIFGQKKEGWQAEFLDLVNNEEAQVYELSGTSIIKNENDLRPILEDSIWTAKRELHHIYLNEDSVVAQLTFRVTGETTGADFIQTKGCTNTEDFAQIAKDKVAQLGNIIGYIAKNRNSKDRGKRDMCEEQKGVALKLFESEENFIEIIESWARPDARDTFFIAQYFEGLFQNSRYDEIHIEWTEIKLIRDFRYDEEKGYYIGVAEVVQIYQGVKSKVVSGSEIVNNVAYQEKTWKRIEIILAEKGCYLNGKWTPGGCCEVLLGNVAATKIQRI